MSTIDVYARVSKRKRDEKRERSPEGQVAACRARLADLGHDVGQVLIDPGRSAWNPKVKRPGWDALMARLESGETDGMITFDLERFSRQPDDGSRLIKLASRGIIVLDSESEYDLRSANGIKTFRDALTSAEYYSNRLSSRVQRGLKLKAQTGEVAYSTRAFGFEDGDQKPGDPPPAPHPTEAPILREMVTRLLAGESQRSLIADLAARGITAPRGGPWSNVKLRKVLLRPVNAGLVVHQKKIVATLPGEPLIPREDFDRLVALFAARRPGRPPSEKYLCSGIATCARCGNRLHGRPRSGRYDDGEKHREYWCGPKPPGCMGLSVDQRGLDAFARELALTILSDPAHAAQVEQLAADISEETARLDAEITEAEEVGRALADRLGRGEITLDRFDAVTAPLDRRLAQLRDERDQLGLPPEPIPRERSRKAWEQRWEAAGVPDRRRMLRLALRGSVMVIGPADKSDRASISNRVNLSL